MEEGPGASVEDMQGSPVEGDKSWRAGGRVDILEKCSPIQPELPDA